MRPVHDVPDSVTRVFSFLKEEEERFLSEKERLEPFRRNSLEAVLSRDLETFSVNVIPPFRGSVMGPCKEILVVFFCGGSENPLDHRVLEAVEHVLSLCHGTTKYVIFWTKMWDTLVWNRHKASFKGVRAFVKLFYEEPLELT